MSASLAGDSSGFVSGNAGCRVLPNSVMTTKILSVSSRVSSTQWPFDLTFLPFASPRTLASIAARRAASYSAWKGALRSSLVPFLKVAWSSAPSPGGSAVADGAKP